MRSTGILVTGLAVAALSGCGGGSSEPSNADGASSSARATSAATPTSATSAPSLNETGTHTFDVTIHDLLPLDAYKVVGNRSKATAIPDFPSQLVFNDASTESEERPLDETFAIPATAQLLTDGSCEATLQVTVPLKDRYRAGVGIEGRGIARPTDPTNEIFKAEGDTQAITVLR